MYNIHQARPVLHILLCIGIDSGSRDILTVKGADSIWLTLPEAIG